MKRRKKDKIRFPKILDDSPVEADLRYWLEHALHWCELLFAVSVFLFIGYSFSS